MISETDKTEYIRDELIRIWDSMIADPQAALTDSQKMEQLSREAGFEKGINDSRFYQSWCLIFLSRLKEAVEILNDLAVNFKDQPLSEDNIKILNALGVAYNDLGDNSNAFFYYSRSLQLSREAGLLERELSVLNNMGGYYLSNENYEKALNHFLELLDKAKSSEQSKELLSVVLSNTGQCYFKLGNLDKAEKFFQESRNLAREIHSGINESEILFDLGKLCDKKGLHKEAQSYFEQSLELCRQIDNKRLECEIYLYRGEMLHDLSQFEKALELSKEIDSKQFYMEACKKLSSHYEKTGDFKEAFRYLDDGYNIEKELNSIAAEKKFHNLEMEYEIERNRKNAEFFKTQNIELKESLNWMTLLNNITKETFASLDTNSILTKVFENINLLMEVTHFHVVFHNKKEKTLQIVKAFENGNEIEPFSFTDAPGGSFAGWSIHNRQELLISDIENEYSRYIEKRAVYGKGPLARSSLTVPIFFRNDEVGAIAILSRHKNAYKNEHIHFLKSLASFLSIAIDNSRNFEKVKELNRIILQEKDELEAANKKIMELATHDNLTGLINRRVLYELLEASMEQTRRRGEVLAVLFIDLDDFKPINDTYGHNIGDKVLQKVALKLKNAVRTTDSVARIGGDEFLILLNPVKSKSEARKVSEKILKLMTDDIDIEDYKIHVGMSIGISTYPEENTTAEQLIINADSAMYRIKKGNKNGIGFFEKT
ncbi:diguanylate cyclase domain-containing protein [Spirochaeta isovalerica]|uniref:Diguanylate cyclase (GGDEF)-like protein n=1 Tax=Spirochaeta isovalerica TaxID=150 RepID=A0A841R4Z1_9SPIO|nr:diguanylate cyclase [Spirochaeta isovalerica]MBB6478461.1 diguanylate cyclase (GGDEF)-like protein [Spirochaeta isovalerica]